MKDIDIKMKVAQSIIINFTSIFLSVTRSTAFVFAPKRVEGGKFFSKTELPASVTADNLMTDIDIMCIANTAKLCSLYDECDLEERDAILNRFQEQSNILSERLAMIQVFTDYLNADVDEKGDEEDLSDKMLAMKADILAVGREQP